MANGYYERGEVYWIGKVGVATLGVVISSNQDNNTHDYVAVAAICGERPHRGVATEATGRPSYIACANVRVVPKATLRSFVGKLSKSELKEMDNHLEEYFDLGYEDDTKDKEIESLKSEVARLKRDVACGKEGIESRNVEVARYKQLYEKALDQMVEMTLKEDLFQRIAGRLPVIDTVATPVVPKIEEAPKVNETSKIVLEFTGKMNVNTARGKDLIENLGMSKTLAYHITSYRKQNGSFVELEELLEVKGFSKNMYEKYKDRLTIADVVTEPVIEDAEPVVAETKKKKKK